MHQFGMRLFKPFWGWTKNTSSSPAQGFFSPLLCPKIFPSYLSLPPPLLPTSPPTSLTSFPTHSISKARKSSWAWEHKPLRRCKHKVWGRWKAQRWRNVEWRKQEECFIPNVEAREESSLFSLLFLLFEKKKMSGESAWNERAKVGGQKQEPKMKG